MSATPSYVPDSPPAKLWELLRRNADFGGIVAEMQRLLEETQKGSLTKKRKATQTGRQILERPPFDGNPFAHLALQWLAPQPLFVVREAYANVEDIGPLPKFVSIRYDKIGRGVIPDPDDPSWTWFTSSPGRVGSASSLANHAGWPLRWGPTVATTIVNDPRIKAPFWDEVAEWREWFAKNKFTLETTWNDAPKGFQRAWEGIWNQCSGFHQAAGETNFFEDWNPTKVVMRSRSVIAAANSLTEQLIRDLENVREGRAEETCPPIQTHRGCQVRQIPKLALPLSEVESARLVQFNMITGKRVFVLPPLLSKQAAKEVVRAIAKQLEESLPNCHELLGTPRAWEVFIRVERHQTPESNDRSHALRESLRADLVNGKLPGFTITREERQRWIRHGRLVSLEVGATRQDREARKRILRDLNQAYGQTLRRNRHFERWLKFINRMIAATYPTLDFTRLGEQTPS